MTNNNSNYNVTANKEVKSNSLNNYLVIAVVAIVVTFMIVVGALVAVKYSLAAIENMYTPKQVVYEVNHDEDTVQKKIITVEYIDTLLREQSQLITAKEEMTGNLTVEEGNIAVLTKKGFSMTYAGYVKAGVDLSKREIEINDDCIIVYIEKPMITDVCIDTDSIVIYDKKRALFNWSKDSDITAAISLAENDMYDRAQQDGIIMRAQMETESIVTALLREVEDDYIVSIIWLDEYSYR